MTVMSTERDPVARRLRPFEWSSGESVAYEAAVEAINEAVGAYTALIAAEETKRGLIHLG
jgi:hypothetical protein